MPRATDQHLFCATCQTWTPHRTTLRHDGGLQAAQDKCSACGREGGPHEAPADDAPLAGVALTRLELLRCYWIKGLVLAGVISEPRQEADHEQARTPAGA